MENRSGPKATTISDSTEYATAPLSAVAAAALERLERAFAPSTHDTRVLSRFPAGAPRGSWPAEEFAAARRTEGQTVTVVMDITADEFVVKAVA